ncbi:DUF7504 family protein [Halobellus rubicundus]|uniref:Uncharacterized protein n=1 Tax=Halobellus rubicundus TaxID=2996466 RepID=A0ABD5M6M1_9EURY
MSSLEQAVERIGDANAVLVLRPRTAAAADGRCKRLLLNGRDEVDVLGVDFSTPPSGWYDEWAEVVDGGPANAALITTPDLADADDPAEALSVETVASPSNLTGVGVKFTPYLNEWNDPVVTVESLTVLLQYADPQIVYRFLHVLTSRLRAADACGQFFFDSTAQDDQTVELLKTLFDAVLEYEGDDEWTVSCRAG